MREAMDLLGVEGIVMVFPARSWRVTSNSLRALILDVGNIMCFMGTFYLHTPLPRSGLGFI